MLCPVLIDLQNWIFKTNFYFFSGTYQSHIPLLCLIILQHLILLSQEMTSENGQIIDHGIAQTNNTGFVTLINKSRIFEWTIFKMVLPKFE